MTKLRYLFEQNMVCGLLLLTLLLQTAGLKAQSIDFGKSYINITKGNGGGTVETGDTLEIRASFVVRRTGSTTIVFDSCAFFDTIPAGTEYIPNSVRVLTNEGKIYKQFSDQWGDDEGWNNNGQLGINLGYNQTDAPATAFRRGRVGSNHRPSIYGTTCIMIASYRIRVTAALNSFIYTGGGVCTYRSTGAVATHRFPSNRVFVYTNYGICSNSVGVNALGTEFNGTFGSGKPRNRGSSVNVPVGYTYARFSSGAPADYFYGIANNTSSGYTTSDAWPKPNNTYRVFSVWDIIGDHTGAADPFQGNPAADTVNNNNGGYMLVVNAAYRIDSAFQQTITNLCPNTYYEISVWMRNICSRCGCDSLGRGAGTAGYLPTAAGDSSGVYPNVTFEIDGTDYYTTGNLLYTGKWVKKGFVFKTGNTQTSCTLKLFNNAPGGGGNDWAVDDITVATCSPNLTFTPQNDPVFCSNNVVNMGSTVRSFFNNYNDYKWQRSTNGGSTWNDLPVTGSATPAYNGGAWEYHIGYPQFVASPADSGQKYRMVVATTSANLNNSSCAFYGNTSVLTLHIETCKSLGLRFLSFNGFRRDDKHFLEWTIDGSNTPQQFVVEHSTDGVRFNPAGVMSYQARSKYQWEVPPGTGPYFRVVMIGTDGSRLSTRILSMQLASETRFSVSSQNPFGNELRLVVAQAQEGTVRMQLYDLGGRAVWSGQWLLDAGRHYLRQALPALPNGIYILQAGDGKTVTRQKLYKQNTP